MRLRQIAPFFLKCLAAACVLRAVYHPRPPPSPPHSTLLSPRSLAILKNKRYANWFSFCLFRWRKRRRRSTAGGTSPPVSLLVTKRKTKSSAILLSFLQFSWSFFTRRNQAPSGFDGSLCGEVTALPPSTKRTKRNPPVPFRCVIARWAWSREADLPEQGARRATSRESGPVSGKSGNTRTCACTYNVHPCLLFSAVLPPLRRRDAVRWA